MTANHTSRAAALTDTIMEQAQVYASAWSLIDGPFDHGNALATAEHEKAELRTLVGDTIAPLVARQVMPADLEEGCAAPSSRRARLCATRTECCRTPPSRTSTRV